MRLAKRGLSVHDVERGLLLERSKESLLIGGTLAEGGSDYGGSDYFIAHGESIAEYAIIATKEHKAIGRDEIMRMLIAAKVDLKSLSTAVVGDQPGMCRHGIKGRDTAHYKAGKSEG